MNMPIIEHPTVVAHRRKPAAEKASEPLDAAWLRQLRLDAGEDGVFNFSACYTHNYREFMGGFTDWVETIADSRNKLDYRRRAKDSETVSMWQSLGFGAT
jgi:hypothetical protein